MQEKEGLERVQTAQKALIPLAEKTEKEIDSLVGYGFKYFGKEKNLFGIAESFDKEVSSLERRLRFLEDLAQESNAFFLELQELRSKNEFKKAKKLEDSARKKRAQFEVVAEGVIKEVALLKERILASIQEIEVLERKAAEYLGDETQAVRLVAFISDVMPMQFHEKREDLVDNARWLFRHASQLLEFIDTVSRDYKFILVELDKVKAEVENVLRSGMHSLIGMRIRSINQLVKEIEAHLDEELREARSIETVEDKLKRRQKTFVRILKCLAVFTDEELKKLSIYQ